MTECWVWSGAKLFPKKERAYGYFQEKGRKVLVHRRAWEVTHGGIPKGINVLHKCDNPPCFRPDHLFLGTQHDNLVDMYSKERRKTVVCVQGHAYTEENTYRRGNGRRMCRACTLARGQRQRA